MTIKLPPLPGPFVVAGEFYPDTPDFYAADQLRTAQRDAALMALEEAAKVCSAEFTIEGGALRCYEAIRAMRAELEAS